MRNNPLPKMMSFISEIMLFKEHHAKYPSHGYRWLNAKIRLDTGLKYPNNMRINATKQQE